ncbi:hypothetical protein EV714DRAFT_285339 [Schizophyllum commune]
MLKRRRAQSPPPPAQHEAPLLPPSPPRDLKRRRTQPPVLDGQQRNGAVTFLPHNGLDDDMGEEPWDEEDDEDTRDGQQTVDCTEYKSANGVLYELHALQRHRLLFSPSSTPSQATSSYVHQQQQMSQSHPALHHPTIPAGKGVDLLMPEHRARAYQSNATIEPAHKHGAGQAELSIEEQRVKERYEGANRALGELFLSRRRQAGAEEYPGR